MALHVKKCPHHLNKVLLFYCENETCRSDICEKCWADNHDKHNVILLSKKVDSVKDILKQRVAINMAQNLSRIKALLKVHEDVTNGFVVVENEVNPRYQKIQEELKKTFDICLEELNKQKKEQQTNASEKMDALCRQQDTFKSVQENLDSEVKPPTVDTFQDYERLVSEMKKLNRDLDEWIFTYKIPKLSDHTIKFLFGAAVPIIYEAVHLDKQEIENMGKHNNKLTEPKESISVGQYQSENSREIQNKDIQDTEVKINDSAASTSENLVTKATEVAKVDTKSCGNGERKVILKLYASIRTNKTIESFAVSPDKEIYITTKNHFLLLQKRSN